MRLVEKEISSELIHTVHIQDCSKYRECILHRKFKLAMHKNKFISPAVSVFIDAVNEFKNDDISYLIKAKN